MSRKSRNQKRRNQVTNTMLAYVIDPRISDHLGFIEQWGPTLEEHLEETKAKLRLIGETPCHFSGQLMPGVLLSGEDCYFAEGLSGDEWRIFVGTKEFIEPIAELYVQLSQTLELEFPGTESFIAMPEPAFQNN